MPRPKKEGAPEPKKRSRTGCWPCKARKVKCGEEKPKCVNCERQGETCDYSIRLNWGGRTKKSEGATGATGTQEHTFAFDSRSAGNSPSTIVFPSPEALTGYSLSATSSPSRPNFDFSPKPHPIRHARSHSNLSVPGSDSSSSVIDPDLIRSGHSHSRSHNAIGQDFRGSKHLDPNNKLQAGLAPSVPRTQITSAPSEGRPFTFRPSMEYPSPSISSLASPSFSGEMNLPSRDSPAAMLPPFRPIPSVSPPTRSHTFSEEPPSAIDHRSKRMRFGANVDGSPSHDSPVPFDPSLDGSDSKPSIGDVPSPNMAFLTPYSPFNSGTPLTPGSSIASDEASRHSARSTSGLAPYQTVQIPREPPDLKRLSVSSLLADPQEEVRPYRPSPRQYPITSTVERTTTYGYDMGRPDLDTPKNDDANAIMIFSPPVSRENTLMDFSAGIDHSTTEVGSRARDMAFESGGYYVKPVPIKIPQSLEPLPPALLENRMNLLYFHHFLNHTARILVPHDCEQNPFRMILPQMALHDEDLLNLLLAYSASHRARLLHQPEPSNRVALWVMDVFPKLRRALMGDEPITIQHLASAIMLASLEILSPYAFEVKIHWRDHLNLARQMIIARGVPQRYQTQDKVSWFLSRWFAYLDVMGSMSGRKNDRPLNTVYWADDALEGDGDFQIDCLSGFTTRCVKILARVAELVKTCEDDRLDQNNSVRNEWRPLPHIVVQAEQLKHDLRESREHIYKPCPFRSEADTESEVGWDSLEIIATNEMFHWAGLIHLDRRVLNIPMDDQEVQIAVREIVGGLYKIRPGSTTEANILFPLFTAGCNALDMAQREKIMSRLTVVETFGMTHMGRAAKLMQMVWDTGKPWESLVVDEFVG